MNIDKKYIPKRFRNKKLTDSSAGSMSISNQITNVAGESHTHANKIILDQITQKWANVMGSLDVDEDGKLIADLANMIKEADLTVLSDDNFLSSLRTILEITNRAISKTKDDTASGLITFLKGLVSNEVSQFKKGLEVGDFIKSLYAGKGAGIDKDGNAEVESLRVRSYMEVMELIVNRLSAIEGDQLLTESDTIERVEDLGDNTYGLYLRSKWDGYFTAQKENNVIKGIINTLAAGGGTYYTSFMRVNSVNSALNYIEVSLYPDDEVPAGKNFPPSEMMNIARWGNQTDKTRQGCIYMSSTEGRIVHLTGVTKPIIDESNYGSTFGTLPGFLKSMGLPIGEDEEGVYIKTLITQNIIRFDHLGKPIPEFVDRGEYDPEKEYYNEDVNPETGVFETSDVWYKGCKWRCMNNKTKTLPRWNNTDWAMVEGNPDFIVEFPEVDGLFDPDRFNLTLPIIAKLHNIVITDDILDNDVVWTRYSEDLDGVQRVSSDNAWAIKKAGTGKTMHLTIEDCDFNGYVPPVLRFIATVTLRDGMNEITEQAAFEL